MSDLQGTQDFPGYAGQQYPGNVMPAPGYYKGDVAIDDELLFSTARFTQVGVTLKPGQGVLPLGCVLGRVTSSKLWVLYDNGNSDGSEVARGVLRQAVDTGSSSSAPALLGNLVISGVLKNDRVSGADADALVDLNARQDTVLNTFTF